MALNKNVLENSRRSFFYLKEKYIQDLEREQKNIPLFRKIKLKKMRESYLRKLNFRKKDLDTFFNEYPLSKKGVYFIEKKNSIYSLNWCNLNFYFRRFIIIF